MVGNIRQPPVASGLRLIIESDPVLTVVADCPVDRAVEQARALQPDLVLLDLGRQADAALDTLLSLIYLPRAPRVAMLATEEDGDLLNRALQHGAVGCLRRNAPSGLLLDAVRVLTSGGTVVFPQLRSAAPAVAPEPPDRQVPARLNARERELLVCLGEGLSNADIAERLYLRPATVKDYVSELLAKLGVRNRTQAAVLAERYGLLRAHAAA
ncbi:DNA-binding response regulator [Kitasatospora xanthocidica]|uniref:DNA-binding response regulator n=1 Tax=Kitasatospora xanthocidica TaxID=83382 RepID=A0A373A1R4_9ACTN|nr:DNA-binding response regulator [Kitasatospora xanthocidica]